MFLNSDENLSTSLFSLKSLKMFFYKCGKLFQNLVVPCVTRLGLALAVPYVISHGILPLVLTDTHILINVQRR